MGSPHLGKAAMKVAVGVPPELFPPREHMVVSLIWHIVLAIFGLALPMMIFVMPTLAGLVVAIVIAGVTALPTLAHLLRLTRTEKWQE